MFEGISAITLATHDLERALEFYRTLGLTLVWRGEGFASCQLGAQVLNLIEQPRDVSWAWWGRLIVYVDDVDAFYRRVVDAGLHPESVPADATWGERYFHLRDPDGHELSFAKRLSG